MVLFSIVLFEAFAESNLINEFDGNSVKQSNHDLGNIVNHNLVSFNHYSAVNQTTTQKEHQP